MKEGNVTMKDDLKIMADIGTGPDNTGITISGTFDRKLKAFVEVPDNGLSNGLIGVAATCSTDVSIIKEHQRIKKDSWISIPISRISIIRRNYFKRC